jgi:cytochrome c biogenesis protein CcmG, thiol:disulfide interchange protein DsbE
MRRAAVLLLLVACGGTKPASKSQSAASSSSPTPKRTEAVKVGDRMTPIAGPLAIPVKGAKLTMVNYFATWCHSSQLWMPHVEAMRKKYAASGLAIVAVANYSMDASQAELEAFVKDSGASLPVAADKDHQILDALPPSGWGQSIIVVDAQGVVRLVHRGTREEYFAQVDAEVGRLLAQ